MNTQLITKSRNLGRNNSRAYRNTAGVAKIVTGWMDFSDVDRAASEWLARNNWRKVLMHETPSIGTIIKRGL